MAALAAAPAMADAMLFARRDFGGMRFALTREEPNMSFSARSIRIDERPWELCPRDFFGGNCIRVAASSPKLNLPRAFSGVVRSARPLDLPPAVVVPAPDRRPPDPPAIAAPERRASPPAALPEPAVRTPEPDKPKEPDTKAPDRKSG
jgi:hypothetical protein